MYGEFYLGCQASKGLTGSRTSDIPSSDSK